MKHVKSIFLMALATAAFASCSNHEIPGTVGPGSVPIGEETYASFNFQVEGSKTSRGAMIDGLASTAEDAVADGVLLIFDDTSGALLNKETFTTAQATANLTIKTTSGSRRIYIITGAADKVLMQAKLNALQTTVPASTLTDFYALMTDGKYTGSNGVDTDMADGFKELLVSNKFVMSNVADLSAVKILQPNISAEQAATGTGEDANVNRFDFNVFRAVAKGSLKVELKQNALTTADGVFTLKGTATYGVRNVNRSTLYVQQFINDKQTSNAAATDYTAHALRPFAAFYNEFEGMTTENLKLPATYKPYYFGGYDIKGSDAKATTMTTGSAGATAGATVYFSENSNSNQMRGNTTYYGITIQVASIDKSKIAGSITYDSDLARVSTTEAAAPYENAGGNAHFWYMREVPAPLVPVLALPIRRVFTDETIAFQAVAIILKYGGVTPLTTMGAEGFTNNAFTPEQLRKSYNKAVGHGTPDGAASTLNAHDVALVDRYLGYYENGNSYYRLNLYETSDGTTAGVHRHLVRRNHNYQATITSFATIGDPTEADLDKDPEKPVDADVTNVTAVIKVVGWHDMVMSDDL